MKVVRSHPDEFTALFESEEEVRDEHRTNLAFGALRLVTPDDVKTGTVLRVTLRGPWGGEVGVRASVVAPLPGGIALAMEGDPEKILAQLLARPVEPVPEEAEQPLAQRENIWDRIRGLSQIDKILLASRADRTERALLLQDNDPRVLLSILRNPRLTVDEVIRLAKSSFLTFQIAEVIMQSAPWMASLDVRRGLIHNPKTPQAFSLRILPTLPDADIRAIAKSGMNAALKQAALRRLQKG